MLVPLSSSMKVIAPHPDRWVQAEIEEALRKKEVVTENAKFLRGKVPSPEIFGTLTYKKEIRKDLAEKIFYDYRRAIAQHYNAHFKFAWGEGYQEYRRAYHHHFMMSLIPNASILVLPSEAADDLQLLWTYGISEIVSYNPGKGDGDYGAAYYLADHANWDVRVACPRNKGCRKTFGCKVERSIW